ncbi:hypothetical protein [Corynebacterium sp. HMSC072A04]|uniref:hypothetical protein n=1 Tax=Corynebacterium sp. HMSC072A04 TaxID=1715045 RepID=UPI001FED57FE|nr:hypothetical protein [Corynebacterium sp. HMSC072A04]
MGDLETYFSYRSSGLDLVGLAVGSVDDLRARGASVADAAELTGLHAVYFGPTRFTGKQRQARAAAVAQRHDVATLSLIESYTARVKKSWMRGICAFGLRRLRHTVSRKWRRNG